MASGGVNPLKYRALVDNVSGWFTEHPLYDAEGQPIVVPEWRFPGRGRVQGQLHAGQDGDHPRREGAPGAAAARPAGRAVGQAREPSAMEVERALEYVELYGLYTECEAIYQVDNLLAMWDGARRRPTGRRSTSTRAASTGRRTSARSTCRRSSSTPASRPRRARRRTDRTGRLRRQVLSPDRHVAAFDLENTLIASNVVESYSWLATRRLDRGERVRYVAAHAGRGARPAASSTARDRSDFLRHFYRRYEDAPVEQIETDAEELLAQLILTKSFPAGIRRVREHRALGHRTMLITGALDFAVDGLRPLFDEIIAAEMSRAPGRHATPAR